jgi:hypothetical protein
VAPDQLDVAHRQERHVDLALGARHDPPVGEHRPAGERLVEREEARGRMRATRRQAHGGPIVGVDDRPVPVALVGEDAGLGRRVFAHVRVPVEVVRREIQQHRDPRAERRRGLGGSC